MSYSGGTVLKSGLKRAVVHPQRVVACGNRARNLLLRTATPELANAQYLN